MATILPGVYALPGVDNEVLMYLVNLQWCPVDATRVSDTFAMDRQVFGEVLWRRIPQLLFPPLSATDLRHRQKSNSVRERSCQLRIKHPVSPIEAVA